MVENLRKLIFADCFEVGIFAFSNEKDNYYNRWLVFLRKKYIG